MSALDHLATQALVGTERQSPTPPQISGAVGDLIRALIAAQPDAETGLLRTAGVLAVCELAGYQPPLAAGQNLAACPADSLRQPADKVLETTMAQIFAEGPERLQIEALRLLETARAGIPHRLLPKVLELGRRSTALRPFLFAVIGSRGRWLAEQNPQWGFACGGGDDPLDMAAWETGAFEQRELFLKHSRARDPKGARSLLMATFAEQSARERAALLSCLSVALGADDEGFIESSLQDRSKDVRQTAAALLTAIPGSRYAARMAARLDACLKSERKLLRSVLTLEAPEQFVPDWKADAMEEAKPQSEALGPRAWWLLQLVRAVPLAWWQSRTSMRPAELFEWAGKSEWSEALWRGWQESIARVPNVEWAEALLERLPVKGITLDPFALIQTLPATVRERHWQRLVAQHGKPRGVSIAFGDLLERMARAMPFDGPALSTEFSRELLLRIKKYLSDSAAKWDYALRTATVELACLIPASLFQEAIEGWPIDRPECTFFAETAARFIAVVEQRKTLLNHSFFT